MPPTSAPRYGPSYRLNELTLALKHASHGNSLAYVGIAGTGKSNLVRVLRDDTERKRALLSSLDSPSGPRDIIVADVNAITWDGTPADLWAAMNHALITAAERNGIDLQSDAIRTLKDKEERTLDRLRANINWLCQKRTNGKVFFILDDFDRVLDQGPLSMLEVLSDLRSSGNREKLSYLIMTKKLPHILGRNHELEQYSKFYDLFRNRIYGVGVYNEEDAAQMVRHLNDTHEKVLDGVALNYIVWLSGGHARLIRIIFDAWLEEPPTSRRSYDLVQQFVDREDVRQECRRIVRGLHRSEQELLRRVELETEPDTDREHLQHLYNRGLLAQTEPVGWFSPVFQEYIRKWGDENRP